MTSGPVLRNPLPRAQVPTATGCHALPTRLAAAGAQLPTWPTRDPPPRSRALHDRETEERSRTGDRSDERADDRTGDPTDERANDRTDDPADDRADDPAVPDPAGRPRGVPGVGRRH